MVPKHENNACLNLCQAQFAQWLAKNVDGLDAKETKEARAPLRRGTGFDFDNANDSPVKLNKFETNNPIQIAD